LASEKPKRLHRSGTAIMTMTLTIPDVLAASINPVQPALLCVLIDGFGVKG
jgi:hypothetical protein